MSILPDAMCNGRMGLLSGAMSIASDCVKLLGAAEKSKTLNTRKKKQSPSLGPSLPCI